MLLFYCIENSPSFNEVFRFRCAEAYCCVFRDPYLRYWKSRSRINYLRFRSSLQLCLVEFGFCVLSKNYKSFCFQIRRRCNLLRRRMKSRKELGTSKQLGDSMKLLLLTIINTQNPHGTENSSTTRNIYYRRRNTRERKYTFQGLVRDETVFIVIKPVIYPQCNGV